MNTSVIDQMIRWEAGLVQHLSDELAEEEPLEIRVRGKAVSVTMRTPGHDEELAAGFLLSENVIRRREDVISIEPCRSSEYGNTIHVRLSPETSADLSRLTRHVFASSSCGLCGKATIESIRARLEPIAGGAQPAVSAAKLCAMPAIMRRTQIGFDRSGGLHAAALFDMTGKMLVMREDIGRHNAVDKVLGHAFLNDWLPLNSHVLLVSGRTSFEIIQKALAGGVAVVAAISAPSSLAVQFASENNQTLIGFLREGRMNVYAGAQRVLFE